VTPVYALIDGLSHGVRSFARGERIDGALPGPLVRQVIAGGEASTKKPKGA